MPSPGSVTAVEEADLWRNKQLADKVSRYACLHAVVAARYQQDDGYRQVVETQVGVPVTAVVPGLEYAVPAAADLAARLGLPGAGPAALLLTDKLALRRRMESAGLPCPEFCEVRCSDDVRRFGAGRAIVLKPAQRQASLGVLRLGPGDDPDDAWR